MAWRGCSTAAAYSSPLPTGCAGSGWKAANTPTGPWSSNACVTSWRGWSIMAASDWPRRNKGDRMRRAYLAITGLCILTGFPVEAGDETSLRKAVMLYVSFDDAVRADFGAGGREFSTRFNHPKEKNAFLFEKGFDAKAFRIAPGKGVNG